MGHQPPRHSPKSRRRQPGPPHCGVPPAGGGPRGAALRAGGPGGERRFARCCYVSSVARCKIVFVSNPEGNVGAWSTTLLGGHGSPKSEYLFHWVVADGLLKIGVRDETFPVCHRKTCLLGLGMVMEP